MHTDVIVRAATLCAVLAAGLQSICAQVPAFIDLTIDVANVVEYQGDIADPLTFAKNEQLTPSRGFLPTRPDGIGNFAVATVIGDLVAVNGLPARGLMVCRARAISVTPNPSPGQAIGDVGRLSMREMIFEFRQADGTPIGIIMTTGLGGGQSPVGSPSTVRGAWAIIGGTGPFVGARGQAEQEQDGLRGRGARAASMAEDPSRRRIHGAGSWRFFMHFVPMIVPQIVMTGNAPAVVHSSDFSPVTTSRPAAGGEVLSLFATGLGAVRGGTETGQPFPLNPTAAVNSPIQVIVNGEPVAILAAVGYPGARDGYQVNFRLPPDTAKGTATLQIAAAWITSSPVAIAVQ